MKTEELIAALAANTRPVAKHAVLRRLLVAAVIGGAMALALVSLLYGFRTDLGTAMQTEPFWIKAAFTGMLALAGLAITERAVRPGASVSSRAALVAVPFLFILAFAALEILHTPREARVPLWLGETWRSCPVSIVGLSMPPLFLMMLAMRHLAPTSGTIAGFAAGVLASGLAATAYGLHCPERAAAFVATWYALGILATGGIGALVGRRVLRW
jgi:hypothetical protein